MTTLTELLNLSKNSEAITIEATVDTGLEFLAQEECVSKLGSDIPICWDRGRVYFNVPVSRYSLVQKLRSVNNLNLVTGLFEDVDLRAEEESNGHNLNVIGELAARINWKKYLDCWKEVYNFNGILYPSREEYLEAISKVKSLSFENNESACEDNTAEKKSELSCERGDCESKGVLRYRVTCYRSGERKEHTFGSQDAARSFGGKVQDLLNWLVNLDDYQLEILLEIEKRNVAVLICLTASSMHYRNITHYGSTTLRSTIAFNLLQLTKPEIGDLIMDPLCGSGSIPIESAVGFNGTFHLCGDIDEVSVLRTNSNLSAYDETFMTNLLVDPVHWDVCALPLRDACLDIIASDLPFGKRVGSKFQNRTLYCGALKELARVVRPSTGRAVLLTLDRTSYNMGLRSTTQYWRQMKMLVVKMGGMKVCVYLLRRTANLFR